MLGLFLLTALIYSKNHETDLDSHTRTKASHIFIKSPEPKVKSFREEFQRYRDSDEKTYFSRKMSCEYFEEQSLMGIPTYAVSVATLVTPTNKSALLHKIKLLLLKLRKLLKELSRIGICTRTLIILAYEMEELIEQIEPNLF
jgi:hypothetical protein